MSLSAKKAANEYNVACVAWRFKLFFEREWSGEAAKTSGEAARISVVSLPGSSRLWGLLSRFPRLKTAKLRRLSTTKNTNKAKGTLKQTICCCCIYLTHIFEVSRFETLISRFFWACFSKPPDLLVMGVGRSGVVMCCLKRVNLRLVQNATRSLNLSI